METKFFETEAEYICPFDLSEEDKKHISRLRGLRQTGKVNMFTDVKYGLDEVWPEDGDETYEWIKSNWNYYLSGHWTED